MRFCGSVTFGKKCGAYGNGRRVARWEGTLAGGWFGVLRCAVVVIVVVGPHRQGGLEITVALTGLQLDSHFLYAT